MISSSSSPQSLSADPGSLNALRYAAGKGGDGGKAALKDAAKQFESLFMRELIKSMREATQKSGLMDGQGSDLGTDLLDNQLSVSLAGQPGGLSAAIERQLGRQIEAATAGKGGAKAAEPAAPVAAAPSTVGRASAGANVRQAGFVAMHSAAAATVAKESGIPAAYMLGQAGHETGWGKGQIKMADGSHSHNLFGIKATSSWKGKVAEVTTTEYVNGKPHKTVAKFRAYESFDDSFRDYARLITKSPRYDQVMDQLGSAHSFASGLQKAGYATDPQYANKLSRSINTALNLQRAQV